MKTEEKDPDKESRERWVAMDGGLERADAAYRLTDEGQTILAEYDKSVEGVSNSTLRLLFWGLGLFCSFMFLTGLIKYTWGINPHDLGPWQFVTMIVLMIVGLLLMVISWLMLCSTPITKDRDPSRREIIRKHGTVIGP